MSILALLPLAAESSSEGGPGIWPYVIGGGILIVLLLMVSAVLSFGRGREHS